MEIQSSPRSNEAFLLTCTQIPLSLLRASSWEKKSSCFFFCKKNTGISLRNSRYLAQDNSGVCEKEKKERKIVCVKLSIYTNKLVGAYFFSPHHVVPALLLLLLCVGSLWSQFFGFGCFFPTSSLPLLSRFVRRFYKCNSGKLFTSLRF